ncbi:uncharacterized protein LOC134287574 [Aedes albopictus]|uniref:Secreted protein n=1 Tax=Aedes albopictus TaxID=7160 RepID=A0ABM1Z4K2_AEDAL
MILFVILKMERSRKSAGFSLQKRASVFAAGLNQQKLVAQKQNGPYKQTIGIKAARKSAPSTGRAASLPVGTSTKNPSLPKVRCRSSARYVFLRRICASNVPPLLPCRKQAKRTWSDRRSVRGHRLYAIHAENVTITRKRTRSRSVGGSDPGRSVKLCFYHCD